MVGVDRDLDGVADVVHPAGGARVGIAIARGVGVLNPHQAAVGDRHVGIGIEGQEGRDLVHPLADPPVHHHAAVRRQRRREERVGRPEPDREHQPPEQSAERDASGALIRRKNVVVAARIVELFGLGADEDVGLRQLAVVDRRLRHLQVDGGHERQVTDEEHRQTFGRHLVDRAERQAVAVGERQLLVDPGAARQAARVQLARRQHDLPVLAVDDVAIVVDPGEVVVGADLLDLPEGIEQRLVVPERHVLDRGGVAFEVRPREPGVARELPLFHLVEPERLARRA